MPKYLFKAHDRFAQPPGDEWVELPNLATARRHAVAGARSLICDDVSRGILDLSGAIEVLDDERRSCVLVRFDEVVVRTVITDDESVARSQIPTSLGS